MALIGLLVVVSMMALAVIVVSATALVGQREDAAARAAFAEALADEDLDEAAKAARDHPGLLAAEVDLALEEERALEVEDAGYVLSEVRLDAGTEYFVGRDAPTEVVLFAPESRDASPVEGTFVAEVTGTHTLVFVDDPGTTLTATVAPVPVEETDLTEPVEGEVAPGGAIDHAFEVFAGEHYYIETFDGPGLTVTFLDDAGDEIETYIDEVGDVRFEAVADGTVRARVQGESPTAAGEFQLDVVWLATYSASYGQEGDDAYLAEEIEPTTVEPFVDPDRGAVSFCLWVRSGVSVELQFDPTTPGTTWDLFTYAEEDAPVDDALDHFTDITASTITFEAVDVDQTTCFDMVPTDDDPDGVIDVTVNATY